MSKARRERQQRSHQAPQQNQAPWTDEQVARFTQEILEDLRGFQQVLDTCITEARIPWHVSQKIKETLPAFDFSKTEKYEGKPLVLVPLPLELARNLQETLQRAEMITAAHHAVATTAQPASAAPPSPPTADRPREMSQADQDRGRELQHLIARQYPSPREALGAVACLLQHVAYDNALLMGDVSPATGNQWAYDIADAAQAGANLLCQKLATDAEQVYALGAILNGIACNIDRG